MDFVDFLIIVGRVLATFVLLLIVTVLNVWAERKIVADMQNRIGPNRTGPFGILQTVADGLKLFFKEQINPKKAEMIGFLLAPFLAVIPAFLLFMVVPWGTSFTIGDRVFALQGTDLNIGVLFVLAMSSMAVYAVVLAGWSSGSKYPLLGGVRATAQAISYEAAMGLSMVTVVLFSTTMGSGDALSLAGIVERQSGSIAAVYPGVAGLVQWIPGWNVFNVFLLPAFVIFAISAVAETNRPPFDLVEAEQELVGGFHTEYSGMRFAMFFLAEYINIFSMSAIGATLFLGGWNGPTWEGVLPGIISGALPTVWFLAKTYVFIFMFFWIRASFPRMRYDRLMQLGWKRLIPIGMVWLMFVAVVVGYREFSWPWA